MDFPDEEDKDEDDPPERPSCLDWVGEFGSGRSRDRLGSVWE